MIRAFCLTLALASPAAGSQHSWPALYDVIGLSSGDVLNIRAEPDISGDILSTLEPDTANIEVIRANDDLTWGLVNVSERTGWISLTYLARQAKLPQSPFPEVRQCFGTEPFWSLTYEQPAIRLSMPDVPAAEGFISGLHKSRSQPDRYFFRGSMNSPDAGPIDVALSIRMRACSDGMSDRTYGIEVDMLVSDNDTNDGFRQSGLFSGCCTIAPPAE